MSLARLLIGRTLPNREHAERKITAFEGVPAMGLDGLGSSAYGPEAALTMLIPVGAAALSVELPIIGVIVALLAILFLSYWQTIKAYPVNAGAYNVAKHNLGKHASLVAAAALMIDYVLNVAVGISAGVGALVSAVPELHPYMLALCLGILVVIMLTNLRGTLDAGRLFAPPTYLFVVSFLGIIAVGVVRTLAAGGHPHAVVPPPPPPPATEAVTVWLVLRAFANGCTAMTGVEAVSDGVGAFKQPNVKYAHRTLTLIVGVLALLLVGIAFLVRSYGIFAMDQSQRGYQSVLSQLAAAVLGRGVLYQIALGSLLCVLALSANTSFVDFPRLCRLVAQDHFLPKAFTVVGRRLVFSVGILYLGVTACLLLVAFDGITEHLIPLFAIGAFLTFTLSQTGMVAHWRRERRNGGAHAGFHLAINAVGATVTAVALAIIVVTKFEEGAWITIIAIPAVVALLLAINAYYTHLERELHDPGPLDLSDHERPVVVVVTEGWNRLADKALGFALRLSPDVFAVHLTALGGPDSCEEPIRDQWAVDVEAPARAAGLKPPRLLQLRAEYRRMEEPLLKLIKELERDCPGRTIVVMLPDIVKTAWWQHLLHTHRARRLRARLLRYGGSRLVLANIPWYLHEPSIDEAIAKAEAAEAR